MKFSKNTSVSVFGLGFVGGAVYSYLKYLQCNVYGYDKYKDIGDVRYACNSDIIFVCVPTPMNTSDGSCDTSSVLDVLKTISDLRKTPYKPLVVIKSTVPMNFFDKHHLSSEMNLVFFPEFLTEKHAKTDFVTCNRMIFGGDPDHTRMLTEYFFNVDSQRFLSNYTTVYSVSFNEAIMAKLMGNAFLMTKVLFANEIYRLCKVINVDYSKVQELVSTDPRIGVSHLSVPGHDGKFGAGGSCFPKDMASLRFSFSDHGIASPILDAVSKLNCEVREEQNLVPENFTNKDKSCQ